MARSTLNVMSYNSTGLDSVKIDWIQDLMKSCGIDLLRIQEHFKATETVEKYFKKNFMNTDSYVIPAFREEFQENGGAKGCLAQ